MVTDSTISPEIKQQYSESTMSKAGRLAMEMSAERKRLQTEMEELQLLVEDLKPATPTGTIDSYVKWVATGLAVAGVFLQNSGLLMAGLIAYAIGSICWIYVGSVWNDKAIMIGSSITGTAVLLNLSNLLMESL